MKVLEGRAESVEKWWLEIHWLEVVKSYYSLILRLSKVEKLLWHLREDSTYYINKFRECF